MLDPGWIDEHRAQFDVMHLHFGSESLPAAKLAATLDALHGAGRPLVYTVHDLSHPQLFDQAPHRRQLEMLVSRADGLITLTSAAAAEIEGRWGRRALVLGHPAMLGPGERPSPVAPAPAAAPVVGLGLRDLRPSIDGPAATAALLDAAARLRRAGTPVAVRVTMRERVRDQAGRDAVRSLCADAAGDDVQLTEEPWIDERRFTRELSELAVSVLPYGHGTHSGWLELCWDLGVPVAAPAIGHFAGQHPEPGFLASFTAGDGASLAGALATLLRRPEAVAGSPARRRAWMQRRQERRELRGTLAAAHLRLYRSVIASVT
jgi:hypothetical protein